MSTSTLALLLFIGIIAVLVGGIVFAMRQKNTTHSGSFASMVAFMDMQAKDKQKGLETVIERQAEKKWQEEENGKEEEGL